ncbi:hypothetical protein P0W76_21995, partial [Tsukamurella sp. 8J]|nr:hypothetical protein [Tsukamurella sp. 8J]
MEDSRDSEYEQGPPPAVLTHAVRVWWIAAVAAAACGGYIALNLATVRGALRDRLEQGVSAQEAKAAAGGVS